MGLLHLKMTGKLKGQTQFVSLNLILGQTETSREAWEENTLKANPEVMGYLSKGYLVFATPEQAAADEAKKAEQDAASATIEDAIEHDSPFDEQISKAMADVRTALDKMEALLSGRPAKAEPKAGPKDAAVEKLPKDDGYDLPMAPPKGLTPRNDATRDYLKKASADKRKFLKECRDIGILREVALFEADPKLKPIARKAARMAEKSAEEASSMASSV